MDYQGIHYERKEWMKLASAIKKEGVDWEAAKEMALQMLGCGEYGEGFCPGAPKRVKSECVGLSEADCKALKGSCTWTKKTPKRAAHCRKTPDVAKARAALQAQRETPEFLALKAKLLAGKRTKQPVTKRPATTKQPSLLTKILQGVEETTGLDVAPPYKTTKVSKAPSGAKRAPPPLPLKPKTARVAPLLSLPEEEPVVSFEDLSAQEGYEI